MDRYIDDSKLAIILADPRSRDDPSLDFNLHQAILKSLATSFASSDAKSAKAAATGKAASTTPDASDSLQTSYKDVLDTFDLSSDVLHESESWTLSDANAVIALAEYAAETAKTAKAMKEPQTEVQYSKEIQDNCALRLHECSAHIKLGLERLQVIKVERCLGGQGEGNDTGAMRYVMYAVRYEADRMRLVNLRHWRKVGHRRPDSLCSGFCSSFVGSSLGRYYPVPSDIQNVWSPEGTDRRARRYVQRSLLAGEFRLTKRSSPHVYSLESS